jgi:hypothetical protein
MDELKFETTLNEVPVSIDGQPFVLREFTGRKKGQYLSTLGKRVVLNDQGKVTGITNFEGMESSLLTLCLFDREGKAVPASTIDSYPSKMLAKLFAAAQELNGLTVEAEEKKKAEAKND